MGKLINGTYGSFGGKVELVTTFSRKGIAYVKSTYKERTKKVSEKELVNHNKFGWVVLTTIESV